MVVVASGVVGQYIYSQLLHKDRSSERASDKWLKKLEEYRKSAPKPISDETFDDLKERAMLFVGVPSALTGSILDLPVIFIGSLLGDIRLLFASPRTLPEFPRRSRHVLALYAIARRRRMLFGQFKKMLGYWHSFHLPFAFIMYTAAVIHILAESIFRAPS